MRWNLSEVEYLDTVDDIIDLFYQFSRAQFLGNSECAVFIDDERELRERLEKILKEK